MNEQGELVAMSVLAVLIVLVGGYYLFTAIRTLRRTSPRFEMLPDERQFLRRQACRRLINSVLMLVLAGLLIGAYTMGMPKRLVEINDERENKMVDGVKPPLTKEQKTFVWFFGGSVIAFLSLLFVIVMLAGLDLMATRRYALLALRKIQTDRRAMIERQLEKWREERGME